MDRFGAPGCIQISESTWAPLQPEDQTLFDPRGAIEWKGKVHMSVYLLTGGPGEPPMQPCKGQEQQPEGRSSRTCPPRWGCRVLIVRMRRMDIAAAWMIGAGRP